MGSASFFLALRPPDLTRSRSRMLRNGAHVPLELRRCHAPAVVRQEVQAHVVDSMVEGVALSQQGGKRPERPGRLRAARSIKKEHPIGWRPTSTRWVGCIEAVSE